jgi:hypothetical protein
MFKATRPLQKNSSFVPAARGKKCSIDLMMCAKRAAPGVLEESAAAAHHQPAVGVGAKVLEQAVGVRSAVAGNSAAIHAQGSA